MSVCGSNETRGIYWLALNIDAAYAHLLHFNVNIYLYASKTPPSEAPNSKNNTALFVVAIIITMLGYIYATFIHIYVCGPKETLGRMLDVEQVQWFEIDQTNYDKIVNYKNCPYKSRSNLFIYFTDIKQKKAKTILQLAVIHQAINYGPESCTLCCCCCCVSCEL